MSYRKDTLSELKTRINRQVRIVRLIWVSFHPAIELCRLSACIAWSVLFPVTGLQQPWPTTEEMLSSSTEDLPAATGR
jgi:hypothetical protein